jgi:DNA-binding MarR family transcriptional regulator
MEILATNPARSQRDLAESIGVSLGHLNSLLKKLVREGHLQRVRSARKSRAMYSITVKGTTEKTLLTYHYIQMVLSFYKDIQEKLRSILIGFKEKGKERIVIFGKGELPEMAAYVARKSNLHLVDIIQHSSQIDGLAYDGVFILELENKDNITKQLIEHGVMKENIILL